MRGAIEKLVLVALMVLPVTAWGDWSAPQFLSSSNLPSRLRFNFGRAIAVDAGGVVHATWLEMASTAGADIYPGRVMYSRSVDDGRSWSLPTPLSGEAYAPTGHPKVAAAGPHVYVAWHGVHDGSGVPKVYLRHSSTQGLTWHDARIISDNARSGAAWPSVSACGEAVHIAWADQRSGVAEVYLRSSPDVGTHWTTVRPVSSPDGRSSWVPTVACWGQAVHVAWADERHNVNAAGQPHDCVIDTHTCREEEYYRRSTDFGNTWEPEVRLTFDPPDAPRPSWAPSIAVWENVVHLVFFDRRTDRFQVYYKRSTGGGAPLTWEPERMVSSDAGNLTFHARPVIAVAGPMVHVVWFRVTPDIGVDVHYTASSDNGVRFAAPVVLNPRQSRGEAHPSVAVSPSGSAHVIWYDADGRGIDQIVHRPRRIPQE